MPPDVVDVSSVFNPAAVMFRNREWLLLRVQTRGRRTLLMIAQRHSDGRFEVREGVVHIDGLDAVGETIYHVYDPRLTVIDDIAYIMFAADVDNACRLGVAKTLDFERFELVSLGDAVDERNGVLFPERISGHYMRLDRPNRAILEGGVTSGDTVQLSTSTDLVTWRPAGPVMSGRPHYWDERIGSGPPPVKTHEGWLHIYHGIATHFGAASIYQAGVVLLDVNDPTRVIARSRNNILEPREPYEMVGQVPNVVFPSGMVVEAFDSDGFAVRSSPVRVYYGAADTCVGLAETTIDSLLSACWHD